MLKSIERKDIILKCVLNLQLIQETDFYINKSSLESQIQENSGMPREEIMNYLIFSVQCQNSFQKF